MSASELFVERMKVICQARGWSHSELGRQAGVSRNVVANLSTRRDRVTLDEAVAIAKALGVTVDQMTDPDVRSVQIVSTVTVELEESDSGATVTEMDARKARS